MSRNPAWTQRCRMGLATLLMLAGCGEARETTAPAEIAPATPAAPQAMAAPAEAPQAATADAARGAAQYAVLCASCHGTRGNADTPIAATLTPKPARHSDGNYMNGLSDAHLFKVIQQGGPAVGKSPMMAAWGGVLRDDQIRDVIAFVRSLADPPYKAPAS
ncbi:MAG: cytochrome c [Myxococcales bacterium]|nr:cytochrome c [Myxococcales bacterium]MDH5306217.1 cytochrome c [Myxococcales bacterium]